MLNWLSGLIELNRCGQAGVLVTVAATRGSTPRERGAKMTVGLQRAWDSIGGGQLEHAAIEGARLLLEEEGRAAVCSMERHALGPDLGQCCGGVAELVLEYVPPGRQDWLDLLAEGARCGEPVVTAVRVDGEAGKLAAKLSDWPGNPWQSRGGPPAETIERVVAGGVPMLERQSGDGRWFVDIMNPERFDVVLFGAGHVGTALAAMLENLPCSLLWIDSRKDRLPSEPGANVRVELHRQPELLVEACPRGAFYVVMTHSHPLDLLICEQILKRGDFVYCGLIGSATKRRNFEKRLRLKGCNEHQLARLTCPIGVDGIRGKHPGEIAVAVAAELLKVRQMAGNGQLVPAGAQSGAKPASDRG